MRDKLIRVLFTGKEHRVRRRETILNAPAGVRFKTQQDVYSMKKDYEISKSHKQSSTLSSLISGISAIFHYNNYISKEDLHDVDLIYSPGKVIFNRFPWVIEVDNVSVMAYYNLSLLGLLRPFIKSRLRSGYCRKIICLSEASRRSVVRYFDDDSIARKCVVVYPYVKLSAAKRKKHKGVVFLALNTKFYMKATLIVIEAFDELSRRHDDIRLIVVSNTPAHIRKKYSSNKRISFFEAKFTKEELYRKVYPQCDVFVQPTLQDSFGLVYLEAMANGLAVISTDIFAVPELVRDGKNGLLIKAPFYMYNKDYSLKKEYFPVRHKDTEHGLYEPYNHDPALLRSTMQAMERLIVDRKLLASMQQASVGIVREKFDPKVRSARLKRIFEEALDVRH